MSLYHFITKDTCLEVWAVAKRSAHTGPSRGGRPGRRGEWSSRETAERSEDGFLRSPSPRGTKCRPTLTLPADEPPNQDVVQLRRGTADHASTRPMTFTTPSASIPQPFPRRGCRDFTNERNMNKQETKLGPDHTPQAKTSANEREKADRPSGAGSVATRIQEGSNDRPHETRYTSWNGKRLLEMPARLYPAKRGTPRYFEAALDRAGLAFVTSGLGAGLARLLGHGIAVVTTGDGLKLKDVATGVLCAVPDSSALATSLAEEGFAYSVNEKWPECESTILEWASHWGVLTGDTLPGLTGMRADLWRHALDLDDGVAAALLYEAATRSPRAQSNADRGMAFISMLDRCRQHTTPAVSRTAAAN